MASESDSGRQEHDERRADMAALEERVARLEAELGALRQRMAAEPVRLAKVPPPAPPMAAAAKEGSQRLRSEAWAAAAAPRPFAAVTVEQRDSLESRLGSQVFNRIAIVLLLIGTAYGMKLAVDRGLIRPAGRVLLGLAAGVGLVLWSERFRGRGFAAFSYSLKAVGSGVLYLSLWAAFQRFQLIPATVALALMVLVTVWNAYMAWVQDAELLAAYALAGGFVTPMLLSTGGNHELFIFSYILAIDVAIVALVRLREWPRLLLGAFPLTVAYFVGWYAEFYNASALGATAVFVTLFGAAFGSVALGEVAASSGKTARRTVLAEILLPLANAAFVALAGYCMLQDGGHHAWLPWLMVALAAVYLGVMRMPQTAVTAAVHLSLAVVLLTVAIPLKASGHWITVSWLVEGLALLWAATRLRVADDASEYAGNTLRWLAMASLGLGFGGVCVHVLGAVGEYALPFFNKALGTALTGIAVFAAAGWMALRAAEDGPAVERARGNGVAAAAFLLIVVTAALLTLREVAATWLNGYAYASHPPFRSGDFLTALLALGIFAGVVRAALGIAKLREGDEFWTSCAAGATIAFNVVAVLTGVREIVAVWAQVLAAPEAGLRQALAISAYLMLYGAALLAAGFWKRSGFLRWQALALLVVTIFKVFLYDMSSLSQGYRVASILGLGAVLMAISFAYQKDWLNLRGSSDAEKGASGEATR